jgi:TonB family protein
MLPKKSVLTFVSFSLAIHIVILTAVGIIDGRRNHQISFFTVELKEPLKDDESVADKEKESNSPTEHEDKFGETINTESYEREDTVNLGSRNTKYYSYLMKLKEDIKKNWLYPKQAYIRKEEGTTVVKFSIVEDGSLINICIMASSGFKSLDTEALNVVKLCTPYTPLPKNFNLSKLNIVANFQYGLAD